MSKRPSLTYQVTNLLKQSFMDGYGRSRHADKKNALSNGKKIDTYTKDKIYSRNTYNSTRKTCIAFVNFCKGEFKIRYLNELRSEMFTEFIKRGNVLGEAYEENTAATYYAEIKKLENIYNSIYDTSVAFVEKDYKEFIRANVQVKEKLSREIHNRIIQKAYEQKYKTGLGFDLCRNLGLRVSELTNIRKEDFDFINGRFQKIHIHRSKGGRSREIYNSMLSEEQIVIISKVYDYFKNALREHERLFQNKKESYETAFRRIRDTITGNSKYAGCGIHSLRKEFAQDFYSREISKRLGNENYKYNSRTGQEIELEVRKELTQILGHNRLEVLKNYLG